MISNRNFEILFGVVYSYFISAFLLWVITRAPIATWPGVSISDPASFFNSTSGGDFQMAYSDNFATNPEVPMATFIKNGAFSKLDLH